MTFKGKKFVCHYHCLCFILQAFGCIDQDRDGVIKKQDLKETYGQLGNFLHFFILISLIYEVVNK